MNGIELNHIYVSYRNSSHKVVVKEIVRHATSGHQMVLFEDITAGAEPTAMVLEIEEFTKTQINEEGKAVPRYAKL